LYSTDGIDWSVATIPVDAAWKAGIFADGKFVVSSCNNYSSLIYSVDGVSWQALTLPKANNWQSIAYGAGKFVIGGENSILYSTDLQSWSEVVLPVEMTVEAIAYGNGRFVASGNGTPYVYSDDGVVWNSNTFPADSNWANMAFGNNMFLAVSYWDSLAMRSNDGVNWNVINLPYEARWSDVLYADGKFILTAYQSTSLVYTIDAEHWSFCILSNDNDITVNVANAITPYLTKDEEPVEGSVNVVSSGSLYNAFYKSVHYITVDIVERDDGTLSLSGYSLPLFDDIWESVKNGHRHVAVMGLSRDYTKGTLYIPFMMDSVRYVSNIMTAVFKAKYNDSDYLITYTYNDGTKAKSLTLSGPINNNIDVDAMELITVEDIDNICGQDIQYVNISEGAF